jgi:hypothetical protein
MGMIQNITSYCGSSYRLVRLNMWFECMQEGAVWDSSCGHQHQKWGHILPQAHHHVQQGTESVIASSYTLFGW